MLLGMYTIIALAFVSLSLFPNPLCQLDHILTPPTKFVYPDEPVSKGSNLGAFFPGSGSP